MKTKIYYYSGTGNSLWTAKQIAVKLPDCAILPMISSEISEIDATDRIGLVFPVHIWGPPHPIMDFVKELKIHPDQYLFAIAVNGGQVAKTLYILNDTLKEKGCSLDAGFSITLPSNYIPWGGPGSQSTIDTRIKKAAERIEEIVPVIASNQQHILEKGPLWQNVLFSFLYKISYDKVSTMDKNFWVDEKCNQCGICEKVCPTQNVILKDGTLQWNHNCQQCLACIQWCPQQAIQYGKKTPHYERYHHPEIKIKEMFYTSTINDS